MALSLSPTRVAWLRALALAILFIVGMTVLLLAISLIFGLHGQAPSYDIVPDPWQGPVF